MLAKLCLLIIFLTYQSSHARVFHLKDQTAGTYIQGTGSSSLLGKTAYDNNALSIENKVDYNASGEFGLMFLIKRVWFRGGVEVLRPQYIQGAQAVDANSEIMYRVDSSVLSFGPVLNMELPIGTFEKTRFFVSLGAGYMKVTVKNDFRFTPTGNTTYGLSDYAEEATTNAWMGLGGLGMEVTLADTATIVLEGGGRFLVAENFQHERPNTTLKGSVSAGDYMMDANNNRLKLDLSGYWVGLGLRFYFNY